MSLERKDIRGKLDADVYGLLEVLLEVDGVTQAEFIERLLVPVIQKRIHDANVIAAKATMAGEVGRNRDKPGERWPHRERRAK